jgi:hypothetical protein
MIAKIIFCGAIFSVAGLASLEVLARRRAAAVEKIPVTSAPVSTAVCHDMYGNNIFRHVSRDRVHQLVRVGCHQWLRCCVGDPWVDRSSADARPWGIGFEGDTGEESAVIVDGAGVSCVTVKGYLHE